MLPVVIPSIREKVEGTVETTTDEWKREMIELLKEDNPEINGLLLNLAQKSSDPKSVILAGYAVYQCIQLAEEFESNITGNDDD